MEQEKETGLFDLFVTFAKIGGLTFGGGVAMLPILQREVVENRKWATEEEMMDYYAIGQCTPGIIAVNTATFIGYKERGVAGGIAATLGVVFPSVVIITILAGLIQNFADLPVVKSAFAGIRVCVCVLVVSAVMKLAKKSLIDAPTVVIAAAVTAGSFFIDISPVWFVVLSAICGILIQTVKAKGGKKK